MTEPSVYTQDVSKLKDADELKQACIGLKDTNRWVLTLVLTAPAKTAALTHKNCVAGKSVPADTTSTTTHGSSHLLSGLRE